jgi:hypothetical protein
LAIIDSDLCYECMILNYFCLNLIKWRKIGSFD